MSSQHPTIDDDALRSIEHAVNRYLHRFHRSFSERDELVQELSLRLLKRSKRFDASLGSWSTFVKCVVRTGLLSIRRRRKSKKDKTTRCAASLNQPACRSDDRSTELGNVIHATSPLRRMTEPRSAESSWDLRNDLDRIVDQLPRELEELCYQLTRDCHYGRISRELNISRSTLYRRLASLKEAFAESGLSDYLCERS